MVVERTKADIIQEAYGKYNPLQHQWELIELLKILEEMNPKIICEIGSGFGGTLFILANWFPNAEVIGIDLPSDPKFSLSDAVTNFGSNIKLIIGDSHKTEIFERVKDILRGRSIDLLFIDGDHSYEGTVKDLEMYGELTKGIITFHDICAFHPSSPEHGTDCEVKKFWDEIKGKYRFREIIHNKNQSLYGIGVIWKN